MTLGRGSNRRCGVHMFLVSLLVFGQPLSPATIEVNDTCSLGDAIIAANSDLASGECAAGSGVDLIELTQDVPLQQVLPPVTSEIALEGNGFTIGRLPTAPDFRILELHVEGGVALRNVTIANGSASADGGGIYNNATLLSLTNARVIDNHAAENGGGLMNASLSELVSIEESTFSGNHAGTAGGGLYQGWGVENRIGSSTLSGNTAGSVGGAVYQGEYSFLSISNSTLSGNSATYAGGGIYASFYSYQTNLFSDTLIGNSAAQGGGVVFGVSIYSLNDGLVADTVAVANVGGNCFADAFVGLRDLGGNFDDDGSCVGASLAAGGVDVDLALANNGGSTLTHAVLPGSVLIGAGGPCGLEEDQRAFPRPPICDSGAIQFAAPVGGSLSDMQGTRVFCSNETTGQDANVPLGIGIDTWDCEAKGLVVSSGDTVRQHVRGAAIDGAAGSVIGLAAERVSCRNVDTGQQVDLSLTSPSWDCAEAGLLVEAGNLIRVTSVGQVP